MILMVLGDFLSVGFPPATGRTRPEQLVGDCATTNKNEYGQNRCHWVSKAVIVWRGSAYAVRENNYEGRCSKAEIRYDKGTPSTGTQVRRWENVCACPVVAKKIVGASMEECVVSTLRNNIIRKARVQRKSGPKTPPARVTMSAITKLALAGPEVISPAFLFWCLTDPGPGGAVTLRKSFVGFIIGFADL